MSTDGSGLQGDPQGHVDEPAPTVDATGAPEAYVIPRALAQAALDYLAAQPYREVFALVRGFESLEPLDPERPARRD